MEFGVFFFKPPICQMPPTHKWGGIGWCGGEGILGVIVFANMGFLGGLGRVDYSPGFKFIYFFSP